MALGSSELDEDGEYVAPIIPNSAVPSLPGLRTLKRLKAILLCNENQLVIPGNGGVQLKLSPGSRVLQLEQSPSGHMLLPISNFKSKKSSKKVAFNIVETIPITGTFNSAVKPGSSSGVLNSAADSDVSAANNNSN